MYKPIYLIFFITLGLFSYGTYTLRILHAFRKEKPMRILTFPSNQLFEHVLTGKFKAPSPSWKHELFNLIDYELFVMVEGTLYLSYGEENFTVHAGDYLLLPPCNCWRDGYKESYCSFYWLHFSVPAMVHDPSTFTLPQTQRIPKLEKMVVLMKQLQDSAKSNYPSITLNAMTTSVITELYGQLSIKEPIATKSVAKKQVYSDILDYIQLNLSKNLKVLDVAEYFGYNEKYLSHLFKEMSGISLKQHMIQRKMEAANFMLTDTNQSIAEISKAIGFPDSHNFSRAYKRFSGLTPSEYRNAFYKRLLYDK